VCVCVRTSTVQEEPVQASVHKPVVPAVSELLDSTFSVLDEQYQHRRHRSAEPLQFTLISAQLLSLVISVLSMLMYPLCQPIKKYATFILFLRCLWFLLVCCSLFQSEMINAQIWCKMSSHLNIASLPDTAVHCISTFRVLFCCKLWNS